MTYKFGTQKKTEYEFPKTRKSFFVFENSPKEISLWGFLTNRFCESAKKRFLLLESVVVRRVLFGVVIRL